MRRQDKSNPDVDLTTKHSCAIGTLELLGRNDRTVAVDRSFFREDLEVLTEIHLPDRTPEEMTASEMRDALCKKLVNNYDGYFTDKSAISPAFRTWEVRDIYLATYEEVNDDGV